MATVFVIQELIDTIVYFLHEDNITLRSASSINEKFHAACSRHIFQSITLQLGPADSQLDDRISRFYNLLNAAPRIAKFVRGICVRGDFLSLQNRGESRNTHLSEILDALTLITSIEICHYRKNMSSLICGKWESVPDALKNSLSQILLSPRLRELTFRNLENIPFASLRLSANLSRLQLMHARFSTILDTTTTTDTNINIPPLCRPRLDSLNLLHILSIGPSIMYLHDPHSPFDLSDLKTLNITQTLGNWPHHSRVWEFIYPLKTNIEHLGLDCFALNMVSSIKPLDLGQLTSLRSLHLVWSGWNMVWINSLFPTLSIPNRVEEVVLSIKFSSNDLMHAMSAGAGRAHWDTLDDAVRDAAFPVLRVFDVNIYAPNLPDDELKAHINSSMVHLRHRGILNVRSITALPVDLCCK